MGTDGMGGRSCSVLVNAVYCPLAARDIIRLNSALSGVSAIRCELRPGYL